MKNEELFLNKGLYIFLNKNVHEFLFKKILFYEKFYDSLIINFYGCLKSFYHTKDIQIFSFIFSFSEDLSNN